MRAYFDDKAILDGRIMGDWIRTVGGTSGAAPYFDWGSHEIQDPPI
jgi:hypothetical protein